jgi:ABC-type sugar transport system substrate-binding protein
MHVINPKYRAVSAALGLVLSASALVACGSGDGGSGNDAKVDQAGLTKARDELAAFSKRPTEIPNKTPIEAQIPAGKKVTFLSAGTSTSNLEFDIIKQATDKLGWTLTQIANDGTPEKVKGAWAQILREKPDGVIYSATDRAVFNSELVEASKMGIKTVACCTTDPADDDLSYVIGTPEQSANVGRALAVWMISESEGKGSSVYVDLSAFKILASVGDEYESTLKELCPACSTEKLDLPVTALGKDVPDRIVSYLRAHPDTKYVVLSVDGALGSGLPAALKAAGLNDIKVIGEGPDETTLQYISSGQQEATVTFPYYEQMFSLVDALARQFAGVPLETGIDIPDWVVTADTLPSDSEIFPVVADVKEQYFKLWGLS